MWQAAVGVLTNLACVLLLVGIYFVTRTSVAESIPMAVVRVFSIAIDVTLFIYLSRTQAMLDTWPAYPLQPPPLHGMQRVEAGHAAAR